MAEPRIRPTGANDKTKRRPPWGCALLPCVLLLFLGGCATGKQDVGLTNPDGSACAISAAPPTVAVLPFGGNSTDWNFVPEAMDPRAEVRTAFYKQLTVLPFRDQELEETDHLLTIADFMEQTTLERMVRDEPARLHDLLGVDSVVLGRVSHFDRVFAGLVSQVAVGVETSLVELPSGKELWRGGYVSRSVDGGVGITPLGLLAGVFGSAWNLREVQLTREAEEAARELAKDLAANLPENFTCLNTSDPAPNRAEAAEVSATEGEGVALAPVPLAADQAFPAAPQDLAENVAQGLAVASAAPELDLPSLGAKDDLVEDQAVLPDDPNAPVLEPPRKPLRTPLRTPAQERAVRAPVSKPTPRVQAQGEIDWFSRRALAEALAAPPPEGSPVLASVLAAEAAVAAARTKLREVIGSAQVDGGATVAELLGPDHPVIAALAESASVDSLTPEGDRVRARLSAELAPLYAALLAKP